MVERCQSPPRTMERDLLYKEMRRLVKRSRKGRSFLLRLRVLACWVHVPSGVSSLTCRDPHPML